MVPGPCNRNPFVFCRGGAPAGGRVLLAEPGRGPRPACRLRNQNRLAAPSLVGGNGSSQTGRRFVRLTIAQSWGNLFRVKLTVKCDYAARAVLGLAKRHGTGRALRAETLAQEQSIPYHFLVRILIELKSGGIVRSQRGKEGGYLLAREPDDITLADVLQCIHGRVFELSSDSQCPEALREGWLQLQGTLDRAAGAISFRKIAEAAQQTPEMYYI